jgi:hypothetical protein
LIKWWIMKLHDALSTVVHKFTVKRLRVRAPETNEGVN